MRAVVALIVVAALALITGSGAGAAPSGPAAFTGGASDITLTTATLTGTATPAPAATTYHFEYGTTTSYGSSTPVQSVPPGGASAVQAAISGLSHTTIYHYRLVVSASGTDARGYDATFRTHEPPQVPTISTAGAGDTTPTSALLTGTLDPHDAPTNFHFEYGITTAYGSRSPDVAVGGYGNRVVSQTVGGLAVNTLYHYRIVATNPTGTSTGGDHTVTTLRAPTAIRITDATPALPTWSGQVKLTGRLMGTGIGGATLIVERVNFPFSGAPFEAKRFTAGADGTFHVTVGPLWSAVRLQVATQSGIEVRSRVLDVPNRVRVGIVRARASRKSFMLRGVVWPRVPAGRISVQRQTRSGAWVSLAHVSVFDDKPGRSRYIVRVPRPTRSAAIRVVASPNDGGAHVRGVSREIKSHGRL